MIAIEGGRGEVLGGSVDGSHAHGAAIVIASDGDAGERGDGGFEFNSEGDAFGLGILRFHRWIWMPERLCVPTSFFLPAIRVVCRAPSARQFAPFFGWRLRLYHMSHASRNPMNFGNRGASLAPLGWWLNFTTFPIRESRSIQSVTLSTPPTM